MDTCIDSMDSFATIEVQVESHCVSSIFDKCPTLFHPFSSRCLEVYPMVFCQTPLSTSWIHLHPSGWSQIQKRNYFDHWSIQKEAPRYASWIKLVYNHAEDWILDLWCLYPLINPFMRFQIKPSGKLAQLNYGKSNFLIGNLTISIAIFNGCVELKLWRLWS